MPLLWIVGIGITKFVGMHPLPVIVLPCIQDELELIFTQNAQRICTKYLTTLLSQLDEELELNVCADRLTA